MSNKELTSFRFTTYGGYCYIGYKKQYLINHKGRIKITESSKYPEYVPLIDKVDIDINDTETALKILNHINTNILKDIITYYETPTLNMVCDASTFTLEFIFSDKSRLSYKQVEPNDYINQIQEILDRINTMNTSLPKYQACYLVRSIHTLDQKYIKTNLHNTKEDAIKEYEEDVQKYITLGIMRLYQVELATIDLITGKTTSKELIVSNSSEFWDEY